MLRTRKPMHQIRLQKFLAPKEKTGRPWTEEPQLEMPALEGSKDLCIFSGFGILARDVTARNDLAEFFKQMARCHQLNGFAASGIQNFGGIDNTPQCKYEASNPRPTSQLPALPFILTAT